MPIVNVMKETELQNAYIGEHHESFTYDFTTSDWWWTPSSWTLRDSNWFYRTWEWSDWWIEAPSEVFWATPKKIIISYNKTDAVTGTWIWTTQTYSPWYLLPYNHTSSYLKQMWIQNGWITLINLWSNPTGNVDWEMDIDSTTTPRTITHSITWLNSFTNNSGVLDSLFNNQSFSVRIVNWTVTWWLHITWVTIEY